jgi:hypothetical protein
MFALRILALTWRWFKRLAASVVQPERLWKQLITWPVVSAIAILAVGIAVGVLSMTPPDFIIAKACLVFSAVILLAKVIHWLINARASRVEQMILSFLIFGLVGVGLVEALRWVGKRQQLSLASSLATPHTAASVAPTPQLEQPTFREKVEFVVFSLGEGGMGSGARMVDLEKEPRRVVVFEQYTPVSMYAIGGKLYADVTMYDERGTPISLLKGNEFTMSNPSWDRNFNNQAFEIVDGNGSPIFQFIYKTQSQIVIKGIFELPDRLLLMDKGVRIVSGHKVPPDFAIKRIFKYPSYKYMGQVE